MFRILRSILLAATVATGACAQTVPAGVFGDWAFEADKSTDMATWRSRTPALRITGNDTLVIVCLFWMEGRRAASVDSFVVSPGGGPRSIRVTSPLWHENWYMGVLAKEGSFRTITGTWLDGRTALRLVSEQAVVTSQGETSIRTTREFRVAPDGSTLSVREDRSSRAAPVVMIFGRTDRGVSR